MKRAISPGATIGIVGGGQLGAMITRQAHRMGYQVAAVDPDPACPMAARGDTFIPGAYGDVEALEALATQSHVVTVETEHVPAESLEKVAHRTTLRPRPGVLAIVQDRLAQREFLARGGFPQTPFAAVASPEELDETIERLGVPAILKSRHGGYDGKGQALLRASGDAAAAWEGIGRRSAVLEAFVDFEREVSLVAARGTDGAMVAYPLAENEHRGGVLHTTRVPARAAPAVEKEARTLAQGIAAALDHVGVITIEFFLTRDGRLLVNEIAPRIHNSGHYTEGPCSITQAEQHLRAITGLPLVTPTLYQGVVMLNILGDAWRDGTPDWAAVLREPGAQLHLYGKKEARPGRKMGHVLITAENTDEAARRAEAIHRRLRPAERLGVASGPTP